MKKHSISLLTLRDLFSCCVINDDLYVYFGDFFMVDIENHSGKRNLRYEISYLEGKYSPRTPKSIKITNIMIIYH